MAQQWAEAAQKGKAEVKIPEQYKEFEEVFSEEAVKCFPPSRAEDHAIKLKPGAPETINCKVYPLTAMELEATKRFIEEHKGKNYIEKTDSPWLMPWSFIKKKDGSLRPTVYRITKKSINGQYGMSTLYHTSNRSWNSLRTKSYSPSLMCSQGTTTFASRRKTNGRWPSRHLMDSSNQMSCSSDSPTHQPHSSSSWIKYSTHSRINTLRKSSFTWMTYL
jgi:hypothetical protein